MLFSEKQGLIKERSEITDQNHAELYNMSGKLGYINLLKINFSSIEELNLTFILLPARIDGHSCHSRYQGSWKIVNARE